MVKIQIRTDNSAFTSGDGVSTPDARNFEIARILENLAVKIREAAESGIDFESVILMDANGNSVGSYTYTPTDK